MSRLIALSKGKATLVDNCDFEYLNQWKWYFDRYAVRNLSIRGRHKIYMHRVIFESLGEYATEVDHIDGDKINNLRNNLRAATRQQNTFNTGLQVNNTSGYKGVQWRKERGKWVGIIKIAGNRKRLGSFDSKEEAARAYESAAKTLHGAFYLKGLNT